MTSHFIIVVTRNIFFGEGIKALVPEKECEIVPSVDEVNLVKINSHSGSLLIILDALPLTQEEYRVINAIKILYPAVILMAFGSKRDCQVRRAGDLGINELIPNRTPALRVRQLLRGIVEDNLTSLHTSSEPVSETSESESTLDVLTAREFQVYISIISGLRNSRIAHKMKLSVKTVSAHKVRVMCKLHATHLTDLLRIAREQGII